ncbi:MAG TPA: flagellar biosynthetic protein FliR, partial [Dehalococcoidia bacterium]|nr:flagellar biosynthetic protein FliR [Dehalococcoidia bacterium]
LIFFLVNAHHQVIAGLFGTFDILPLNTFSGDELNITAMIQISAQMFISAVQIALPIVAALFMTDVALAVIARTMPQLNVLIVGMPVKIAVGLLMLMTALPATTR